MAKTSYTVTVDPEIAASFREVCTNQKINQSMLIESFMRSYVNDHIRLVFVNNKPEVEIKE